MTVPTMYPVRSTWVEYVGLDSNGLVYAVFKNGTCAEFQGTTQDDLDDLLNAQSVGKFIKEKFGFKLWIKIPPPTVPATATTCQGSPTPNTFSESFFGGTNFTNDPSGGTQCIEGLSLGLTYDVNAGQWICDDFPQTLGVTLSGDVIIFCDGVAWQCQAQINTPTHQYAMNGTLAFTPDQNGGWHLAGQLADTATGDTINIH